MFEDLELQAEGLALAERDAEVAELARSEYAEVDLGARLHGSVGCQVAVTVVGVGTLEAGLAQVGADWLLLASAGQEWMVRLAAVASVRGASNRALGPLARPLSARLGMASALRRVAETAGDVTVLRTDGSVMSGTVRRVGADFAEVQRPVRGGAAELVPFWAIAAVRRG